MRIRSLPWLLWLVPIALLIAATGRLPFGYYTFTRIVVFGVAAFLAVAGWNDNSATSKTWSIVFAMLAVVFNPIFPIYLRSGPWFYFDIVASALFAAHLVLVRLRSPPAQGV